MRLVWMFGALTFVVFCMESDVSAWLITAPMPPPVRDGVVAGSGSGQPAALPYLAASLNRKAARVATAEKDKNYRLGLLLLHMCNNPELAKFPFSDEFWGQLADMIEKERSRQTTKGTAIL
ncbi:uncharacterized protein LOC129600668 isoform X1 [Paramacrobiotus metropolitanus]|uniref:uncharacterized protein LOC129600668 isoform X1 n=1 Tax=Paramacrobiotus metropolitanus TaxID=2943436 RepID=UPI002445E354|nr:uncharacterized protein LOC129600668 isoform X1 [Paramacrobiotus metropolitanus]